MFTSDKTLRREKSQTNFTEFGVRDFDTLNTPKRKWTKQKLSAETRETNRTLTPITTLSSYMTAMDVDSDDDDEIIAERGTKSI